MPFFSFVHRLPLLHPRLVAPLHIVEAQEEREAREILGKFPGGRQSWFPCEILPWEEEPHPSLLAGTSREDWLWEICLSSHQMAAVMRYQDGSQAWWAFDAHQHLVKVGRLQAVASLILNPGGTLAMVASVKRGGKLGLPAGKLEPGESPLQGALREAKEETGIDIERAVYLGTRTEGQTSVGIFLATHWRGRLESSTEGEAIWGDPESCTAKLAYPDWMAWALGLMRSVPNDAHKAKRLELSQLVMDTISAWSLVASIKRNPWQRPRLTPEYAARMKKTMVVIEEGKDEPLS